ncbi:MAG: type II secretion system protein GspK [Acidobacteriota bacterium]
MMRPSMKIVGDSDPMINARKANQGVILIALLWILTILSVIALSFARETFVEVGAARNARDLVDAYYIARAGIATTVYQLYQKMYSGVAQGLPNLQGQQFDAVDLGKVSGTFGDGEFDVDIQDESGKINLNFASEDQLRALVQVVGIGEPDADIIVDSILDWRIPGDIPRANGAKDSYYQTLQPPYAIWKDGGRMKAVEELLLVRGVTPEYYYGRRERTPDGQIIERYGLSKYLTVYGTGNRININSAPLPVLLSIPGMPPAAAQAIYERRQVKPFVTVDDLNRDVVPNPGPTVMSNLTWQRTSIFTLTASAHRMDSKARRIVRAVVRINLNGQEKYTVLYWNENVPNW